MATIGVCYRLNYLSMQSLRPKDLAHEVLKHWRIGLRQIPGLHHLRPSTCNLRFPQALCDERREQDCAHGIRVVNLPGGQSKLSTLWQMKRLTFFRRSYSEVSSEPLKKEGAGWSQYAVRMVLWDRISISAIGWPL